MSEPKQQWYRAKKGSQPGVIPGIGLHDHAVPILPRDAKHEKAILATGLYEEAPAPKAVTEAPAEEAAPTLADAAAAAEAPTDSAPTSKGGKK